MDIVFQIIEVRIPVGFSIYKCGSYIDDDRFFRHHFTCEKSWLPDSDDDNISIFRDLAEVWCRRITCDHRRSRIDEHE